MKSQFEKHPHLTLFTIFFVFLFILDILLGFIFIKSPIRVFHPFYHHSLLPNSSYSEVWGDWEYVIRTNSLGFKDQSNKVILKNNGKCRILFLGDSFVEGVGIEYKGTFSGIIANQLNNNDFDVLNAGVISYSPKLCYLKLKYLIDIKGIKIDTLIMFVDVSDVQDEIIYESFHEDLWWWWEDERFFSSFAFFKNNSFLVNKLSWLLFNYKRLVSFGFSKAGAAYKWDSKSSYYAERPKWGNANNYDHWGRKGFELASKNILKINEFSKKHKFDFVMVIYPWPQHFRNNSDPFFHQARWVDFAKGNDINLINLFPSFLKGKESSLKEFFIEGDIHWNEKGHELVASELMRYVFMVQ
jgi:hypothetical protein